MSTFGGRTQITDRLAFDPNLSTGGTDYAATSVSSMPIDFSGGVQVFPANVTIPGGTLGPNGYIEVLVCGAYSFTAATRTVTFRTFLGAFSTSVSTELLPAGNSGFQAIATLQNQNDETIQGGVVYSVFGGDGVSSHGPYIVQITDTTDTTSDWSFQVGIVTSGTVNTALVRFVRVLTQFIP